MKKNRSKQDPVFKLAKKQVNTVLEIMECDPSEILSNQFAHTIRLCSKKLRALLQLYRPYRSKATIHSADQFIKALANSFSSQRDAQVQYELICRANKDISQQHGDEMQPLLDYVSKRKQQAENQNFSTDPNSNLQNILRVWTQELRCNPAPEFTAGVDFTYRKSRKLARVAQETGNDDKYHQCRKWVKYYLYQLRMLSPLKNNSDNEYLDQYAELGELLGELHDYCVMEKMLFSLLPDLKLTQSRKAYRAKLQRACLLMLNWLEQHKQLNKTQSHKLFSRLFKHKHNPIII